METYITISKRTYEVVRCDFVFPDGTIRLIVADNAGKQKRALFNADGSFEEFEKAGMPGKVRYARVINMRR